MARDNDRNCAVHGFDPTSPEALAQHMQGNPPPPRFKFHNLGVAATDGSTGLNGWDYTFPVKRVSTIMRDLNHTRLEYLKMDVEGMEYDVLEDMLDTWRDTLPNIIPQIAVEFHFAPSAVRTPVVETVVRFYRIAQRLRHLGYKIFYKQQLRHLDEAQEFWFVRP